MARYDLPDEVRAVIQPLLPAEPASPRAGRPWAEHRKIINGMFRVLWYGAGAIDLNGMVHGKPFTIALTGGQSFMLLTIFSTGFFRYLMQTVLLTGLPWRWMAAISVR